ncbi:MAG: hypothetical protein ACTSRP_20160 [Candidatus Helarchaeota archaeon]
MLNTPHEHTVNVCLAEVLCDIVGDQRFAIPENPTVRNKRFDVKINHEPFEIVLEASYDKNDAINDAKKRIQESLIDTISIAVYYDPKLFSNKNTIAEIKNVLKEEKLKIKIFSLGQDISMDLMDYHKNINIITEEWIDIKIEELIDLFKSIEEYIVKKDVFQLILNDIEENLKKFLKFFNEYAISGNTRKELIKRLYITLFSPKNVENIIVPDVPNEVIFAHGYISLLLASVLYESIATKHKKESLHSLLVKHRYISHLALREAFLEILKINYEPAFDSALRVLDDFIKEFDSNSELWNYFNDLIKLSIFIVGNKSLLRQDFIGYIYHKVTGDIRVRKSFATYYTKHQIAYLLAFLTFLKIKKDSDIEWNNLNYLKENFKICDFACGSGTLLSASYEALLFCYRKVCFEKNEEYKVEKFHKIILENSILGFDALEHAIQTTSIVLSLKNPKVSLDKINTYQIPVNENGSLGSLNYWWGNKQLIPIKRRDIGKIVEKDIIIPYFDIIIMNPPFSRTTAPGKEQSRARIFDFVVKKESFKKLWDQYIKVIDNIKNSIEKEKSLSGIKFIDIYNEYVKESKIFRPQDINPINAGASLPFSFLAHKYLKNNGRLILVLPKTTIESSSYFLFRALLLINYHIEFIIISSEPQNTNFSYSTNFSEVLLIARKLKNNDNVSNQNTYIINLKIQPKNALESILLAKYLIDELDDIEESKILKVQSSEAEIFKLNRVTLETYIWNFSMFLNPFTILGDFIIKLSEKNFLGLHIPLKFFKELNIEIVTPRTFRGTQYKNHFMITSRGQYRYLDNIKRNTINQLKLKINKTTPIKPKNVKARQKYQNKASNLLVVESIRFNTTPLIAVYSDEKIISGNAYMIRSSKNIEKALCVWLNSTYIIGYLNSIYSTIEELFGHIRAWHIRILPVPDFTKTEVINNFIKVFEKYKDEIWDSLPSQYEQSLNNNNKKRLEYDLDVIEALANAYCQKINRNQINSKLLNLYRD